MDLIFILLGVILLYAGGEALVRGSVSLARALGIRPLVIGLTVVSFGTSSPELASTLAATLQGSPAVAFGNVVGSNIANIGLILGVTGLIWPLATTTSFIRREVPFMMVASVLMFALIPDGEVGRLEGAVLIGLLATFLLYLFRREVAEKDVPVSYETPTEERQLSTWLSLLLIALGLAMLVFGADLLIDGAIRVARAFGVSERVIGLTMVALGTSLPELASSIVAAMRREGDIVLGNIIGSNLFNILCILGITSLVRPVAVGGEGVWIDLVAMLVLSAMLWAFLAKGLRLVRWEAALLLAGYAGYMAYLF